MATSALTTATASALTSTLPDAPKSAHQSPRNQPNPVSTSVAVQTCVIEVSKSLLDGEKFIKWDEVNIFLIISVSENRRKHLKFILKKLLQLKLQIKLTNNHHTMKRILTRYKKIRKSFYYLTELHTHRIK
jgi:hypothetical protein